MVRAEQTGGVEQVGRDAITWVEACSPRRVRLMSTATLGWLSCAVVVGCVRAVGAL